MFIPSYKKPAAAPEPYVPCSWSDGTDEDVVEALEKHYAGEIDLHEYWSVGDERTVILSAMSAYSPLTDTHASQNAVFVLTEIGGKTLSDDVTECCFQVDQKNVLTNFGRISYSSSIDTWYNCDRYRWCNITYRNAIPETLRSIFKQFKTEVADSYSSASGITLRDCYFSLRSLHEVSGAEFGTTHIDNEGQQAEYYKTSSNQIKSTPSGDVSNYWLRSIGTSFNKFFSMSYQGYYNNPQSSSSNSRLAPFGVI